MAKTLKLFLVLDLFIIVLSKTSHLKELDLEDKDHTFMNLFDDEGYNTTYKRYARHVQVITESALDHLYKELKEKFYKSNFTAKSPLRKFIREFGTKMKRRKCNRRKKAPKVKNHHHHHQHENTTTMIP